ncbi:MAG: glucose-1-phosphate cytidylyltransferase [Candidatus Ancaeobacter aquaticus]|nr:glucose-1-phosphate cytidylyltransferase [Candidatus Ancaeobacter aquaticus]
MKVVILAGGLGTRLSEETAIKPKPMLEIGNRPILWHIMKMYSHYGFNDFVICLGYKGYLIKEYFSNYFLHQSDVEIDLKNNKMNILNNTSEDWKVTLIDTGYDTMTGGRLKYIQKYIDGTFMLTYGDGVSDIDIAKLVEFHREKGKIATITSVQPEGRFGMIQCNKDGIVEKFNEKPMGDGAWVNAGYFVFEPEIFNYLGSDPYVVLEKEPFEKLALDNEMYAYKHKTFWKCMDTQRDKNQLEEMWADNPKWKIW